MARAQTLFVCRHCGGESLKWQGQCPHCSEWNSLERITAVRGARTAPASALRTEALCLSGELSAPLRVAFGIGELDRVFGGGLTPGSVTLLGGEPGIGKSTLLLQVAASLGQRWPVLYASGEESAAQIGMRAQRLALNAPQLAFVADNNLDGVLALARQRASVLLIIDSIQTMQLSGLDSSAGSVQQLREGTAALVRFAKVSAAAVDATADADSASGDQASVATAVMIVGHVTKDGAIAGPKLLEHLVDTVLYFESDAGSRYRMLRATKNRFGPINELGFFAMTANGLKEVKNPSAMFVGQHREPVPGSLVMVARDGSRPLLIEVQALVDRSRFGMPRRVAQGVDTNRVSMLLAVLSRHAELSLAEHDVFVNLVGGIEIAETATDLPLALALASSLRGQALPTSMIAFGELGLTGEVRPVAHGEERLRELAKQGYLSVILPRDNAPRAGVTGLRLKPVATIAEALAAAFQSTALG